MTERCRRSLNQRVQGSQGQVCVQSWMKREKGVRHSPGDEGSVGHTPWPGKGAQQGRKSTVFKIQQTWV